MMKFVNQTNRHLINKSIRFSAGKQTQKLTNVVFLSDIDGTWLDKKEAGTDAPKPALFALNNWFISIKKNMKKKGINLIHGYVTGRPPGRVDALGLPESEYNIFYNGGEIFKGLSPKKRVELKEWEDLNNKSGFSPVLVNEAIKQVNQDKSFNNLKVDSIGKILNNKECDASDFIKTYCIMHENITRTPTEHVQNTPYHETSQVKDFIQTFKNKMTEKNQIEGKNYLLTGPYPSAEGGFIIFDVATPYAHKEEAVEFLLSKLGKNRKISTDHLIIACDGGNDIKMCTDEENKNGDGRRLIILGDNKKLKEKAGLMFKDRIIAFPAGVKSSLGVLRGLQMHLADITSQVKGE